MPSLQPHRGHDFDPDIGKLCQVARGCNSFVSSGSKSLRNDMTEIDLLSRRDIITFQSINLETLDFVKLLNNVAFVITVRNYIIFIYTNVFIIIAILEYGKAM